jgi:PAS domain S-box-containing protein
MAQPREALKWLQATYDESPLAIAFSRDGVMVDANPAYAELFGYRDADELRGIAVIDQIAPSERARITGIIARRASGQEAPVRYRTRGLRKDGTEFPFEIMTRRIVVPEGPITMAFIADVSELQESEERFRTLSSAAFEGVFIHAEGKIVLANEAGAAMYGFTPETMVGVSLMDLTAPESRELVAENVRRGMTGPYEGVAMRKDGSTFIAEARGRSLVHRGSPIRVVVIRDVTEQKALAERMRTAQKLESLGALAGGVAHDFNNVLTVITNSVELAKTGKDTATHLENIKVAAARATELCRQMLAYAGKGALAREAVDLSTLVDEMLGMLDVSVGKKAILVRDLAPDLPSVVGDATQLRQIVLNLVLNAAESITKAHGRVVVSTGVGEYGAGAFAKSAAGGEPKAGAYVHVEVRDDGEGMDAETAAHMFDPFFTTKLAGRGLGMATVLGIVRGHGGAIDVESSPGRGTRVRVFFPAAGELAKPKPGVVLVVDDESGVRTSTKLLLEQLGFVALVARDGHEAIEIVREIGMKLDVVLLDRTMPRLDGMQTMKLMREIAPSLPIVLTSGQGEMSALPERPDAVLAKPYSTSELLATLRRVMAR